MIQEFQFQLWLVSFSDNDKYLFLLLPMECQEVHVGILMLGSHPGMECYWYWQTLEFVVALNLVLEVLQIS